MEGLISANRFHCSHAITYNIAEKLLEMPKLEVIQFHDVRPDNTSLKVLNDVILKRRKDITLRVYSYSDLWADISFLYLLPDLEKFDWETAIFGSNEPLYKLKKLTHLGLGFTQPKPKISISFIADFKDTLNSLNIEGDYKDLLTTIPLLKKLNTIWLSSTKLKGFDFLEGLPIYTIGNYGGRIESFDYLKNIQTLKKIWIKTNPRIENIDFIENLYHLEDIEMQYVSKVIKFPKCSHLQSLKRIFVFECNRLQDIDELKKMQNCNIYVSGKKVPNRYFKKEHL